MQVGRYEIVRELGRGGMARVHLARQVELDRLVALKELLELQREDAEMVGRFVRESRLAGALNHESIVTVLDVFEHDEVVTSPWSTCRAVRCARGWVGSNRPSSAACSRACSPGSRTRTRRASCTATSSPRTCWSTSRGA